MPYAKVNDINMYYEIHGEGESCVFIHGAGGNTKMWEGLVPIFSAEYKLVIFDPRGAGQSDKPDIPYTMEMMADDLAGLLDIIGIESAHLRGTSMGGMIALQYVLRYPERVRSLILDRTSCGGHIASMISEEQKHIFDSFLQEKLTVSEMLRELLLISVSEEFLENNPDYLKWFAPVTDNPLPSHVWRSLIQAQFDHDVYNRLPEIKVPTLVMHGELDRVIPAENAKVLASRIPGAELVIFENAGHACVEAGTKPEETVLDFLKRHSQ